MTTKKGRTKQPETAVVGEPAPPEIAEPVEEPSYLTSEQMKQYLKVITKLDHMVVCRLLICGLSVKELMKLRPRDVKSSSEELKLKDPARRIKIDHVTVRLLIEYMGKNRIHPDSPDKLLKFNERNLRYLIKDIGETASIPFSVSPKTLQNTFFAIQFQLNPTMTLDEYHQHLGYSDIDYTRRLYSYFKKRLAPDLPKPIVKNKDKIIEEGDLIQSVNLFAIVHRIENNHPREKQTVYWGIYKSSVSEAISVYNNARPEWLTPMMDGTHGQMQYSPLKDTKLVTKQAVNRKNHEAPPS